MRSLLLSLIILIPLVVFFIIIDRNDFFSGDEVVVQGKQQSDVNVNHANRNQGKLLNSSTKSQEASTPMTESIAEDNNIASTNSEIASVPDKERQISTESLLTTTTHSQDSLPRAIPAASPEEAIQMNKEAIEYSNREKRKNDETFLEGIIVDISKSPNPTEIDYPDCNLAATVQINDIDQTKIVLIIPCIRDSKTVLPATIKENELIAFRVQDESLLSEDEKSIQLVDDSPNYEMDYCYSEYIEPIASYSKVSRYFSKEKNDEIAFDSTIVLTGQDTTKRKDYMSRELERLNKIISDYSVEDARVFNNSLLDFTKSIEIDHPYAEIQYEDNSRKIFPLEVNVSIKQYLNWAQSNDADLMMHNARVIASVDKYFRKRGILLLVVPVPHPYESYVNRFHLSNELSTYNINRILFMRNLLSLGVEVLDVEPMIEENITSPFHYFLLFKQDVHLSEMGAYYVGKHICDHLKQYDFLESLIKDDYSIELERVKESVTFHGETFKDMDSMSIISDISPIDKQSPFLLVGDSFTYTSHIQSYISYFLKTKINVISRGSSFPTTAQLLQLRKKEISPNTKVCILLNSSSHLGYRFLDFLEENENGIQIYPSSSLSNLDNLCITGNDLLKESSFDLNLPELPAEKTNKLIIYSKTNDEHLTYTIGINSQQSKSFKTDSSGTSCIEIQLVDREHLQAFVGTSLLHLQCSASPQDGFPVKNDSSFQITRIVLVEE